MELKEFIATLEESNFSLSVDNGTLHLKGDKNKLSKKEIAAIKTNKDVIDYIKLNKERLIEYLTNHLEFAAVKKSKNVSSVYRLSGLQQGMLFHGLYDVESSVHKVQFISNLVNVDTDVFTRSWNYLIKRHSILRTGFFYDAFNVPVQCVYNEVKLPIEISDYRHLPAQEQSAALKAYENADRVRGFDFKTAPLMRLALLRLTEERYQMVWTFHHILFDGWSLPILMEEFLNTYELLITGKEVKPGDEDRYEDYIRYLERIDKNKQEAYWRNYLAEIKQSTLLPFIGTTKERNKGAGVYKLVTLALDINTSSRIQNYAQRNRLTANTVMQGVWSWLLHRYTDSEQVVFGVVVSGRPDDLPGVEHRVGMFINTIPLRAAINAEQEITAWLLHLQEEQVASAQYQHTALHDIQHWSGVPGDLFDSLLVFENYPVSKIVSSKQWSLQVENVSMHDPTNYPLTILVNNAEQINISFHYNAGLLEDGYVEKIRNHFEHVLLQIIEDPELRLKDIELLTAGETRQLLLDSNSAHAAYPNDATIPKLFEEQVEKNPDHIAVVFEDEQLTYKQLNERSNQLAHYLRSRGVRQETLVPICIDRSLEMIVGILGILKAGAAYVPVDPQYPDERINYILNDTAANLIICDAGSRDKIKSTTSFEIIDLATNWPAIEIEPSANLFLPIAPGHLAYVIYTSGSTGMPKGAMNEHHGVLNRLLWGQDYFGLTAEDSVLQKTTFSFDISVWELFWPLLAGARLVFAKPGGQKDNEYLKFIIDSQKITLVHFVPSMLGVFLPDLQPQDCKSLRKVLCSGEALRQWQVALFREKLPGVELHNLYGPTEAAIEVTCWSMPNNEIPVKVVPIGKPVSNTAIYILDNENRLVPTGVSGQIHIAGKQVGRGYLNQADLTAEKFIADPFSEQPGRMYQTGDIGRWLPGGDIEYLGRADEQVKIHGYRIEPGEIETVLKQNEMIRQVVVVAKEDSNGEKMLVGYVVTEGIFDRDTVISWLKDRLPEYMVPSLWLAMESLPLLPNGKTDRKALANLEINAVFAREYIAPRNEIEQQLAMIWQELLDVVKIGIQDNFFDLGGHSLLAMRTVSAIRRSLKAELAIKSLFENPTIAALAHHLRTQVASTLLPPIKMEQRPQHIPLSFSQERLWFIDQLEGSIQYHIPAVLHLKGKLEKDALSYAFKNIVARHEVLRTVIREMDGQGSGYQYILDEEGPGLTTIDGSKYQKDPQKLKQFITGFIRAPFDLSKDHMLRAGLVKLDEEDHVLVVAMHHIASDGWSLSIIVKELVELYESFVEQREHRLPALPIQYADYSIWQRKYLQGELLHSKLAYWKQKLEGVAPLLLPVDYERPVVQSRKGANAGFQVDKHLAEALQQLSRQQGVTLFMTLLSAFKVLLHRYSGQEDICVGTPIANRTQTETEELIGFFVNTLALRSNVQGNAPFTELLQQVSTTTLEAYQHQDMPFEKVVDAVVKERDLSSTPLFQVMFVLHNTPEIPEIRLGEIALTPESFDHNAAKFDLTLSITATEQGLRGSLQYCTDLFSEGMVTRIIAHFTQLLQAIAAAPNEKVASLPMLAKTEQHQLLNVFNNTSVAYSYKSIVSLFEEQAALTPGAAAVVFGQEKLTYQQLDERSNELAHYLQSKGVKEETLVPICIDKSLEMMIGILAVLKAGGAYVPVDPAYPGERIRFMLEDTQSDILLTTKNYAETLQLIFSPDKIVALDGDWNANQNYPVQSLQPIIQPNQLAYVLYTSGSTGKPKGVAVEHFSLANHLHWFNRQYKITKADSTILLSSFSFDGSMTSTWPVLLSGGTLHIPADAFDPAMVLDYIAANSVSYIKTLPAIFKAIINADNFDQPGICKTLRLIIVGGERMNAGDFKKYIDYYPAILFANHYGPTECTISSTFCVIDKTNIDKFARQSIVGKPVDNSRIFIISEAGQLSPAGVAGEICITGAGVARGYLNQPALTAEKFVINPFGNEPAERMYKTGDIGRWLEDGNIEYLGRKDDQVKIRGYRIELGEIESILKQSELLNQSAVLAKEDQNGDSRLVTYVVSDKFNKDQIIAYLNTKLPAYMVPTVWVQLDSLPLSPNGKINRSALPDPGINIGSTVHQYIAPQNEYEHSIAKTWQELLGIEQVSVNDNFFQLGGHSLMAMRVISAIRRQLKVELAIKDIFLFPTISALAEHLHTNAGISSTPALKKYERPERIPLSFSQERLWFIDQLEGSIQYHLPTVLQLAGDLRVDALTHALQTIINRHEVLRTVILENDGQPYQYVLEPDEMQLEKMDGSNYKDDPAALRSFIRVLINTPFDLSKDQMMRATLIQLNEQQHVLVVTTHHIASDGWSTSVLVKEVVELYQSFVDNRQPQLPVLEVQYADYALWQRSYLQGDELNKKINYWKEKLRELEPLRLPLDYTRPAVQSTRGAFTFFSLDSELVNALQQLSQQEETTLFMTLLTAFKVLLYRYSGQLDICVGTGVAGRDQQELENLVGFFVNTLALRTRLEEDASFTETLQQVKTTTLEAFDHQDVPFAKLVDAVMVERDMSRSPVFQVIFVLQNTPDIPELKLGDVKLSSNGSDHNTSKFDLTFILTENSSGLRGSVEYCTDLFTADTIGRMMEHYKELLNAVVKLPKQSIATLPMINSSEAHRLLVEFNDTRVPSYADLNLVDLFEKQVLKNPNNIAVIFKQEQLSFKELNEQSNQLAHYLSSKGVTTGALVPLCIDQSIEMIIAIWAILKAGATYIPVDPEYPQARINFILQDTAATVAVSSEEHITKLQSIAALHVIDTSGEWRQSQPIQNLNTIIDADQVAYIIYTSGSTGKPKGVMVSHAALLNYLLNSKTNYTTTNDNAGSFIHLSYTFDASLTAIFMPLLAGKTIVVGSKKSVEVFEDENCWKYAPYDFIKLTPSHLELLQSSITNDAGDLLTHKLVVGGEALRFNHFEYYINEGLDIEFVNEYGPTEATVGCSTYSFNTSNDYEKIKNGVSIGKPIDNVQLYILNNRSELSPVGVAGEICIGGAGLANGYLNLPELTAEKFIPNPFDKENHSRLYKTGDIGRWLANGNLEYLGRVDDQVKIKGYRIELGEIESCLSSIEYIKNATLTVTVNNDLKKLNAYLQVDRQKLPLLGNYLHMLHEKQVAKSDLHVLPNGLPILNSNLNEVKFLYNEIFEDHCYLKHGITLDKNSCVIDIGANAGFFTVFLNVLSEDIKVYSIEPIPEVYHYLVSNRQLYNIKGKAFQLAILDVEQDIDFTYYPGVSIVSGISEDREEVKEVVKSYIKNSQTEDFLSSEIDSLLEVKLESKRISVHAKTISQIIAEENIEKIDLLKIDVENSEHHVINGIAEKDWDRIGSIIIEVHDSNGRLDMIKHLLEEKGFHTYVEKEQMLSKDDILYNLFAIKNEQQKGLTTMGENDLARAPEWMHPEGLENDIRTAIEEKLPEYMMPAHIILVDQFKLTSNGKIDKKALPAIEAIEVGHDELAVPETDSQKALLEIWKNLLEVESIGLHDNFFNVGGDSLLAVRLISVIRKELGVELRISDLFEHPTVGGLALHLSQQEASNEVPSIVAKARPEHIPLSFSQERLWFIDQLQGSAQYHIPAVLRLKGSLNKDALNDAMRTIVNRHEVLRTVIKEKDGQGYQYILPEDQWKINIVDGSIYINADQQLEAAIQQLINAPFNLAKDQMIRADLIRLNDQDHILAVTMHHIVSDGWSMSIIVKEVVELYAAYVEKRPAQLPALPIQYADFAIWQRSYLQGAVLDKKINYWKNKLEGITKLELPVDYAEANATDTKGAISIFSIEKDLADRIQLLSQQHGATLFMTLLAGFNVLLYRYSGQQDICVGTSVAGRQMQEVEGLIGFFINALALRTQVNGNASFEELLKEVRTTTLEAYENQDVPFEKVVDAVLKDRDMSHSPLFQVVFAMQNTIDVPELNFGGVQLSREGHAQEAVKFDLICNVSENPQGLQGSIQYVTGKYSKETIDQMIGHYKELLAAIVAGPGKKIDELARLKNPEDKELLAKYNDTTVDYLWEKTIVDLFENQAAKTPDAIAVIFEQQQLTYKELNEWSNQLAHCLRENGVEEESLVPLCIDRSIEMIVAVIGILKAGGVYIPLDPAYPEERIQFMLKDTRASLAVASKACRPKLEGAGRIDIIDMEKENPAINSQKRSNVQAEIEPNHLAYIIYTSGSTGKPKGVSIMHRSNVNMSLDQVRQFGITSKDKVLQFASISFDASVSEIFMAFYAGATLVLMSKETIQETGTFTANLVQAGVTVVTFPPVYLKALQNDDLSFLRVIITAGEPADVKQAAYLSKQVNYYNAYGPTECAVCASIYKVVPEDASRVRIPIGKPIANTNMYILDDEMQLLPVGMQGEIYVSGMGLAKGYLKRPDLTAEKFVTNPFGTGKKLYRTGDLGRWLKDGNIEFLGRKDDQVKIRGYRVELGEIESTLLQHKDVEQAVVVVKEAKDDKQLIAYYQPKKKIKLWPSVAEFYVYDDLLYKTMAGDEARNAKYRNAFRKVVKDKVILEIGPGFEAVLSRICIEEGAKKVYAVELLEESYHKAKQTVEALGLQDKIIVIHDDITKVELPEKADYCISEIVGAIGGSEGSATLINASRRLLKDPACMIPSRSLTKIAAITLPEDEFDYSFEELGAYYTNKIFEAAGHKFDLRLYLNSFPIKNIISTDAVFEDLDYTKESKREDTHEITLEFNQDALAHGFIVWLNLYCDPEELIDTVAGKYTWLPIFFPAFDQGEKVSKGDFIKAKVSRTLSANSLNPDFVVAGTLYRKGLPEMPFEYESLNHTKVYKGNNFYKKVFANDELKIAGKIDKDNLRDLLKSQLPDYMVPSLFMELDEFPVTISGKIDKKALPEADAGELLADQYIAPGNKLEEAMVAIWQEVLELDKVGIHDDFFELGGHSLLAIRLISLIRKKLNLEVGIGVIFEFSTIASLAAELESKSSVQPATSLTPQQRPEYIPLSFSQERLLFIDRLEGTVQYHIPAVLRLQGKLDIAALANAFKTIVLRHEVLRTVIRENEGQGYQLIMDPGKWELNIIDNLLYKEDTEFLGQYTQEMIRTPFDLSKDYMLRVSLLKIADEEHVLVVTMHHIASDGWSLSIMVKELVELYSSFIENRPAALTPLQVQYADYSIWQRNYLQGEVLAQKLDYWNKKLTGVLPLQLPADYSRPAVQSTKGAVKGFLFDKQLAVELNLLGQQYGATLFMTLLAAFKVLLHRYSGQEDICVGTPIANRISREVEELIGFFVNTLALRSEVNDHLSFAALLQQVKATTLEAYEHQDVPFEKVVDIVMKQRDMSRHPLFQVMFVLQNAPDVPEIHLGEVLLSSKSFPHTTSKFDITLTITETINGLQGKIEFCTDLYTDETIGRMIGHFEELLNVIVKEPTSKIGILPMLKPFERHQLLVEFNDTDVEYAGNLTIPVLFEKQVQKTPGQVAVVLGKEQLTYQQLNERSNQLAHLLTSKGVNEETLVPICLERSMEMIVAILGILKSGGAYVPIDPEYPEDRISFLLGDINARVIVCTESSKAKLAFLSGVDTISLDGDSALINTYPTVNPDITIRPDQLAYVIYTSGSTGKPKGAMNEHGAVVNRLLWGQDLFKLKQDDTVLQKTTFSFDVSVWELLWPLLSGARLVFAKPDGHKDNEYLKEVIEEQNITVVHFVPSMLGAFLPGLQVGDCKSLQKVFCSGEALKPWQVALFKEKFPGTELHNLYGPTEAAIEVTRWSLPENAASLNIIPIGKPVPNNVIYILDKENNLVPIGCTGEIHIGGKQVGRGYLNQPELTKEKFIPDPFSSIRGAKAYKTGDIGRWLPDGNIEYLGRIDDQVKIRGYRIELGEIETVLQQSEGVKQAVVLANEDKSGTMRLIGYVVPEGSFDKEAIISCLSTRLPGYMVPVIWVEVKDFPLLSNGKINKKALPDPDPSFDSAHQYVAPGTEMEQKLAAIWQQLLGIERIGMNDNFFDLGGHSLLAMRMVSSIRGLLQTELAIKDLFTYPTLAGLTLHLREQAKGLLMPAIEVQQRPEFIPLSFSQERLFFIDRLEGSTQYHLPGVLRLRGLLDIEALSYALQSVIARHEVLRTVIHEKDGEGYQQILDAADWEFNIEEAAHETQESLRDHIQQLIKAPFDLSNDYMLRVNLLRITEAEHILVLTVHHIASDGWSLSILVKEVVALYGAYVAKLPSQLPALAMQYADYAIWQRRYVDGELLKTKLRYWKEKLGGVNTLQLPTDRPRPAKQTGNGALVNFRLDEKLSLQLKMFSRQNGVTLFMTLLSAFKVLLHRYSGQQDICVGTPTANRPMQEMEELIGFFVNTLALRSTVVATESFTELLQHVKTTTLEAFEHQEVPFEKVVDVVTDERVMNRNPLFQVMFILQNTPELPAIRFGDVELSNEPYTGNTSKFDLTFAMAEANSLITGSVEYATDLYNEDTIVRMTDHFKQLLGSIVNNPQQNIELLPMLAPSETRQLLFGFNDTHVDYRDHPTITNLFEQQVQKTPGDIAVVFGNEQLTYRQLNERANQFAHYLRSRGVKAESLVPICVERSLEMIIGVVGILKAGAVYVPVDPEYPATRINYILDDTAATLMITSKKSRSKIIHSEEVEIIEIDSEWPVINELSTKNIQGAFVPDQLAYILYTSGSTGIPKGVKMPGSSLVNLLRWQEKQFDNHQRRVLQFASLNFDVSFQEIFSTICFGSSLYLVDEDRRKDMAELLKDISEYGLTHLFVPYIVLKSLAEHIAPLNLTSLPLQEIIVAGEQLKLTEDIGHFLETNNIRLINQYGPTEAHVVSSYTITPKDNYLTAPLPPIGKPVDNTRLYILNTANGLCPIGVPGELYIAGAQVASGYLNRPELTSEKFIADLFNEAEGSMMYKTGDLARWLPDGNIEYLGRMDEQVKIRGYRVEPGEIETVLQQNEMIRQAVVLAREDNSGNKRLVGYVVTEKPFDREEIISWLKSRLPEYMVPALWIDMEQLPVSPNGKVDRRALPNPDMNAATSDKYVAPRNEMEQELANIWQELLGVERVGIHDNFFHLGGHSLLAMKMVSHMKKRLMLSIPIQVLFQFTTISDLSNYLEWENDSSAAEDTTPFEIINI